MEEHFSLLLGTALKNARFIPAPTFSGSRPGYYFTNGLEGLGYYLDTGRGQIPHVAENPLKKMKRSENQVSEIGALSDSLEVEPVDVAPLDTGSLKQLLNSFLKKCSKNEELRAKFSDTPEKFMESEVELHSVMDQLFPLAASPELYPIFISGGGLLALINLLTHENTDISIQAISLLQELIDSDILTDESDCSELLINCIVQSNGLEILVQNMTRFDESIEEDAAAVHNTLSVIENLIDLDSSLANRIGSNTVILSFLLGRLQLKTFDPNKLYCSEILSILLQKSASNRSALCEETGLNGVEKLLEIIAPYRKKEPESREEQECVENIFLSLNAVLVDLKHQDIFRKAEGLELMIRCIQNQKYISACSLKAVDFALMGNRANCLKLIELSGLRLVFPILMGRGSFKGKVKKEIELVALSIICTLCTHLHSTVEYDCVGRLISKLLESESEKFDRCVEIFSNRMISLRQTELEIQATIRALESAGDEEALENYTSDINITELRLRAGLLQVRQAATILAFACAHHPSFVKEATRKLADMNLSMKDIVHILDDHCSEISFIDQDSEQTSNSVQEHKVLLQSLLKLMES